jgi:FkbM family methyltransferase
MFLSFNWLINNLKLVVLNFAKFLNIGLVRYSELSRLRNQSNESAEADLKFLKLFSPLVAGECLHHLSRSKSQIRQDLFVLAELGFKKNGYFVEFGSADGINLSNSFILENDFSWTGILAEPARVWHDKVKSNRPNSIIETKCVWKSSGEILLFNETKTPELSTVDSYSYSDSHFNSRKNGNRYEVKTISLNDLLETHKAPRNIDYLSIDTEGSEFEILNSFNFGDYDIKVITCEHNYGENRDKIYSLLVSKGYVRKYESVSLFDDWYVKIA